MAKKKRNKPNLFIMVFIYACLLFAMYISLSTITLGLWGNTVMGTVDSYNARLDNTDAGVNRSRTISKGYYFTVNGRQYRGHVMYASDESWSRLSEGETRSELISYFPFFPYINKPSALTDFSRMGEVAIIYHIFSPIGCLFLLLLINGAFKRKKKKKKAAKKIIEPINNNSRGEHKMFCQNCANNLSKDDVFCSKCGMKVQKINENNCAACKVAIPEDAAFCINCGMAVNATVKKKASTEQAVQPRAVDHQSIASLIGFSERYNSPEISVAAQKNKKNSIGCMSVLVIVPLIGFPIAGLLMDDFPLGESIVIGAGIAFVMLIINLLALRKTKRPMWEGVVVNKYSKERSEHRRTEGESDTYSTYTEYTTVIKTNAGKKKTIVERDSGRLMYDYLSVGDKVRFHPRFGTYEKYDKSKDRIIYCNVCSMMNPIQNDRCKRCDNLLFK